PAPADFALDDSVETSLPLFSKVWRATALPVFAPLSIRIERVYFVLSKSVGIPVGSSTAKVLAVLVDVHLETAFASDIDLVHANNLSIPNGLIALPRQLLRQLPVFPSIRINKPEWIIRCIAETVERVAVRYISRHRIHAQEPPDHRVIVALLHVHQPRPHIAVVAGVAGAGARGVHDFHAVGAV